MIIPFALLLFVLACALAGGALLGMAVLLFVQSSSDRRLVSFPLCHVSEPPPHAEVVATEERASVLLGELGKLAENDNAEPDGSIVVFPRARRDPFHNPVLVVPPALDNDGEDVPSDKNKEGLKRLRELAEQAGPLPCSTIVVGHHGVVDRDKTREPRDLTRSSFLSQAVSKLAAESLPPQAVNGCVLPVGHSFYGSKEPRIWGASQFVRDDEPTGEFRRDPTETTKTEFLSRTSDTR